MQISNNSLDEFIMLYKAEFRRDISQQDALEMATRLINLYQIIYRPLPGELNAFTPPLKNYHAPDVSVQDAE